MSQYNTRNCHIRLRNSFSLCRNRHWIQRSAELHYPAINFREIWTRKTQQESNFAQQKKSQTQNDNNTKHIIDTIMALGKEGGKKKPLKAPKKEDKVLDEADLAHREKLKNEKKALEDAKKGLKAGKPLGTSGIKKSGKK